MLYFFPSFERKYSHSWPVLNTPKQSEDIPSEEETGGDDNTGVIKLTKPEKRAKAKKIRKEAKKQGKTLANTEEAEEEEEEQTTRDKVLVLYLC